MAQITINHGTHEDVLIAASVAGKCKVIGCPNPADAASPVTLHAGDHRRQIGQSADYRHNITADVAESHGALAIVQSWWDNDAQQWYATVDGDIDEAAVKAVLRKRIARREAKATAERQQLAAAAEEKRTTEYRSAKAAYMAAAKALAEQWAPGRVAVWEGQSGRIFAGRWDEPNQPGYGTATETREVLQQPDGRPVLESAIIA